MKTIRKKIRAFVIKLMFKPVRALTLVRASVKPEKKIVCVSTMKHLVHQNICIHYEGSECESFSYHDVELFESERTLIEGLM